MSYSGDTKKDDERNTTSILPQTKVVPLVLKPAVRESMIDSRNVYKVTPLRRNSQSLIKQQVTGSGETMRIKLTKDDTAGNGQTYFKTVSLRRSPVQQGNAEEDDNLEISETPSNDGEDSDTTIVTPVVATVSDVSQIVKMRNIDKDSDALVESDKHNDNNASPRATDTNSATVTSAETAPQAIANVFSEIEMNMQQRSPITTLSSSKTMMMKVYNKSPQKQNLNGSPQQALMVTTLASSPSQKSTSAVADEVANEKNCILSISSSTDDTNEADSNEKEDELMDDMTLEEDDVSSTKEDVMSRSMDSPTTKMSREMKCLRDMQNSSLILTKFIKDSSNGDKLRKRKQEGEDNHSGGTTTPTLGKRSKSRSDSPYVSGSVSVTDEMNDDSGGINVISPTALGSGKRTGMRSANAEFTLKQRKFLNSIHSDVANSDTSEYEEDAMSSGIATIISANNSIISITSTPGVGELSSSQRETPAYSGTFPEPPKPGADRFCWRCKNCAGELHSCSTCVRSFHLSCMRMNHFSDGWRCPDCAKPPSLSSLEEKSYRRKDRPNIDSLHLSLTYALKRMESVKDSHLFNPFLKEKYRNYSQYVTNHTDLQTLQEKVSAHCYATAEQFLSDVNWVVHNSTIYPENSKILIVARALLKAAKREVNDIEACSECYLKANTGEPAWFTDVCSRPHLLVWAKVKGFPFWPAKLMSVSNHQIADVRFFGDHDRAPVPLRDCFLFCEKDPNAKQQKRANMTECLREADEHIAKLAKQYGTFTYAEFRHPVEADRLEEHLESMIPGVLIKMAEVNEPEKTKLMLKIIKNADNILSVSPVSATAPQLTQEILAGTKSEGISEQKKISERRSSARASLKSLSKSKDSDESNLTVEPNEGSSVKDVLIHADTTISRMPRKRKSAVEVREETLERQNKVATVVIQRKSDSWKMVPAVKRLKPAQKDVSSQQKSDQTEQLEQSQQTESSVETELSEMSEKIEQPQQMTPQEQPEHSEQVIEPQQLDQPGTRPVETPHKEQLEQQPLFEDTEQTKERDVLCQEQLDKGEPEKKDKELVDSQKTSEDNSEPIKEVVEIKQEPSDSSSESVKDKTNSDEIVTIIPTAVAELPSISPTPVDKELSESFTVKQEPVSDDEIVEIAIVPVSSTEATESTPVTVAQANQIVIHNKRIAVRDIQKLTHQINARGNVTITSASVNQQQSQINLKNVQNMPPLIIRATEKAKNQQQQQTVSRPQVLQQQRARKTFPTVTTATIPGPQLSVRAANVTSTMTSQTVKPTVQAIGPVLHMVQIPSPLASANDNQPKQLYSLAVPTRMDVDSCVTVPSSQLQPHLQQQQQQHQFQHQHQHQHQHLLQQTASATLLPVHATVPTVLVQHPCPVNTATTTGVPPANVTPTLSGEMPMASPPKLRSRPLRSEGDQVFVGRAGPVSQLLSDNAHKMVDFFRSVIEDTVIDIASNTDNQEAQIMLLKKDLEQVKYQHKQDIEEVKLNCEREMVDLRKKMEQEKSRIISEIRKQCEVERIRAIDDTKKKQWCIHCGKEAQFYCCWNTSYCDYPCQQHHWPTHMHSCTQSQLNLSSMVVVASSSGNTVPTNSIGGIGKMATYTTPKIAAVHTVNVNGRGTSQQQKQQPIVITASRAPTAKTITYDSLEKMKKSNITPTAASYSVVNNTSSVWSTVYNTGVVSPGNMAPQPATVLGKRINTVGMNSGLLPTAPAGTGGRLASTTSLLLSAEKVPPTMKK